MEWGDNWINIITLVFLMIQYKNIFLSSRASVKLRHCLCIDTALYTDVFDTNQFFLLCLSLCHLFQSLLLTYKHHVYCICNEIYLKHIISVF